MNGANQNEIDLMLPSLAREQKSAPVQTALPDQRASDHLDADELNSFAEGLMPEPARLRYTEHLADCAVCRRLVVDLTQAAGASARREVREIRSESGFWQKLSALFAPSVLRFAVPALVLAVVAGIGLFALKRPNEEALVAVNHPVNVQPAANGNSNPAPTGETTTPGQSEATAPATSAVTEDKPRKLQADQTPPLDTVSSVAKEAPAKAVKDADEVGAGAVSSGIAELRPSAAPQPKPAPPPPVLESEKSALSASRDKRDDQARADDELKGQEEDVHGPNRARNAPMSTSQRAVGGVARNERGPSFMNKNKGNEAESRAVSGKRFTRDNGVWVVVDYGSQATTRVSRGSEQFRALVADEPGIGAIAQQLDGPVIVVWKGRAYRIQ